MPISTDTARRLLDHLNGRAPLTITGPLKLYIKGINQSSSYTHPTFQVITFAAADRGAWADGPDAAWVAENETAIVFPNLPAMTVTGWFITDSSPTPVTIWEGVAIRVRDVPAGDSYEVPAGALKMRLVDVVN